MNDPQEIGQNSEHLSWQIHGEFRSATSSTLLDSIRFKTPAIREFAGTDKAILA